MISPQTFIGIDCSHGTRPYLCAVLDATLHPVSVRRLLLDELLAYLGGLESALVAVNAPASLAHPNANQPSLYPDLPPRRGRKPHPRPLRSAELELLRCGLRLPPTPTDLAACPRWMDAGFSLYQTLPGIGYQNDPMLSRRWLETNAQAGFHLLLGNAPMDGHRLEGRLQRQMLLYNLGLRVPDPMNVFEEITPFKLLHGALPVNGVYESAELNALLCAYTAWLVGTHPEKTQCLGSSSDGEMILPQPTTRTNLD
jgi:hypothetical protein